MTESKAQMLLTAVFHCIAIFVAFSVIVAVFSKEKLILLAFHPVFMSIGVLLLMSEALVVYKFDPHKDWGVKRRTHASLQIGSGVCIIMGVITIFSVKIKYRLSAIPSSIHEVCGILVFMMVIFQVVMGWRKYHGLDQHSTINKYHPKLGLGIYGFAILTVCFGIGEMFEGNMTATALLVVFVLVLAGFITYVWWPPKSRPDSGAYTAMSAL
mmetsp:Transcript_33685/g.54588  ORF Transcript_33685/g.54588 Transcript_33685/m.54588 type:complete len:212 (+) Transcript_33685:108-743(+)